MSNPQHQHVASRLDEYADGELSIEERAEVEDHLKSCVACAEILQQVKGAARAIDALPKVRPSNDFEKVIVNRLKKRSGGLLFRPLPGRGWVQLLAIAIAALGLALLWWMRNLSSGVGS